MKFYRKFRKGITYSSKTYNDVNLTTTLNYQVHEAGITTGLPHHRSSYEEIDHLMKFMECFLKTLPAPTLITMAR